MRIYVNDNKDTGCDVVGHFLKNWNKDTLHPLVAKIPFIVNRSAQVDSIVVEVNDAVVISLFKNEALRLDLLQSKILEL